MTTPFPRGSNRMGSTCRVRQGHALKQYVVPFCHVFRRHGPGTAGLVVGCFEPLVHHGHDTGVRVAQHGLQPEAQGSAAKVDAVVGQGHSARGGLGGKRNLGQQRRGFEFTHLSGVFGQQSIQVDVFQGQSFQLERNGILLALNESLA